jgi:glycerol-3-phosphate acyltransferase PlsY
MWESVSSLAAATEMALVWSLALVFGYLCGSVPFGVLLTRLAGAPDVRGTGSGNIGATNVLRTGRKGLAAATLAGDLLKGTVAVLVVMNWVGGTATLAAALGVFLGHLYPVWLDFKGGKGVATYIGILVALAWPAALAFCGIWLVVAALTRYSSLSGLVASTAMPAVLWFMGQSADALLFTLLTGLLFLRHAENIVRLRKGTERRIGTAAR